ncbi:MAG TPA: hypothetical protein VGK30_13870 [Candidatus Binatia bacterium]
MEVAELVVLLVIAGALYVALAPLRRVIVRRMLRRRGREPGQVIPLIRNSDGVYTPSRDPARRSDGDER